MRTSSLRMIKLVALALVAVAALATGVQLAEQPVEANEILLCSATGQPCRQDTDCARLNPTCFCANVSPATGQGICRGDFEVTDVSAK